MTEKVKRPLGFVENPSFSSSWEAFGLPDDDLRMIQNEIMRRPQGFPVIPGTGGLRKMRFAPSAGAKGKRGALRIGYVYFAEFELVLLVLAFHKSIRDDISPAEKKVIRAIIHGQKQVLIRKARKGGRR